MAAQTYQSITNNCIVKAQLFFFPFFFLSTSSIIWAGVEGGESFLVFLAVWVAVTECWCGEATVNKSLHKFKHVKKVAIAKN